MSWMNPGIVSASDRVPPPMVDSASSTRTDLPAPARTMAAASPFGPAPTITASSWPSAKIDDAALCGGFDLDRVAAMGRDDRIDLVIGPCRIVVKQQQPLGAGRFGEADGVLDSRVPRGAERCRLRLGQLSVVDQQVRTARQGNGGGMIGPEPGRSRPKRDRAVVREIGDSRSVAGHPVPIRQPAFVGDVAGDDVEPLDRPGALLDPEEAPFTFVFGWLDREMGWRHDPRQHVGRITLGRHHDRDFGVGPVAGGKEREPMGVVPVQVTEQDRASKRPAVQKGGQSLQTGDGVEYQGGRLPIVADPNAGSIAAVSHEVGSWRLLLTSYTAEEQAHRRGVYGLRACRPEVVRMSRPI